MFVQSDLRMFATLRAVYVHGRIDINIDWHYISWKTLDYINKYIFLLLIFIPEWAERWRCFKTIACFIVIQYLLVYCFWFWKVYFINFKTAS